MEFLILAAIIGLIPAYIANKKGGNFFLWWFFGWMLWIVAMPCAILMKGDPNVIAERDGLVKCPLCAEWVKEEAVICKHCRKDMRKQEE